MANAFWGGFARTMGGIMDERRQSSMEMDRQRALKELEKEFAAEIVDSQQTRIIGDQEVRYNRYGTEISRRTLSPQELELRQAELDKTKADTSRSQAEASLKGLDLANYEEDRQRDYDDKLAGRSIQERQLGLQARGLDLESQRISRMDKDDMLRQRDQVTAVLMEAGDEGDVSAMSLLDQYDVEYNQATTDEQRRAVIAKYMGLARNRLNKTKAALRGATGGRGLDALLQENIPFRNP